MIKTGHEKATKNVRFFLLFKRVCNLIVQQTKPTKTEGEYHHLTDQYFPSQRPMTKLASPKITITTTTTAQKKANETTPSRMRNDCCKVNELFGIVLDFLLIYLVGGGREEAACQPAYQTQRKTEKRFK